MRKRVPHGRDRPQRAPSRLSEGCRGEYAALEAGDYFAGSEITPEPVAVTFTCSLPLAQQLLAIARASCPDVATGICAAIDQQTHPGT